MTVGIKEDEYLQNELRFLIKRAMESRELLPYYKCTGEYLGAEIMLYYLLEEPEEFVRFLKLQEQYSVSITP